MAETIKPIITGPAGLPKNERQRTNAQSPNIKKIRTPIIHTIQDITITEDEY